MKRSMVVAVIAAVAASLTACGDEVAGHGADRVTAQSADNADAVTSRPVSFGRTDLPVQAQPKAPKARRGDDDIEPQPIALPDCPGGVSPHFNTPEAAMVYLASAWNRDDLADLCQVTNPNARLLLLEMHREAVNLRLNRCSRNGVGAYVCLFDHDYPKKRHKKGIGHTWLDVAAADNPGWYMTVYEGCG